MFLYMHPVSCIICIQDFLVRGLYVREIENKIANQDMQVEGLRHPCETSTPERELQTLHLNPTALQPAVLEKAHDP